jgi:hypothetical protein
MILLHKIVISCKQATLLHEKMKEGKLDAPERFGLWIHLLYCKFCKRFIQQMQKLEASMHHYAQNAEKLQLTPQAKASMKKAFTKELDKN